MVNFLSCRSGFCCAGFFTRFFYTSFGLKGQRYDRQGRSPPLGLTPLNSLVLILHFSLTFFVIV